MKKHIVAFYAPEKYTNWSSFFSWAIAKVTESLISHVAVLVKPNIIFHAFWFTRLDFLSWVKKNSNYSGLRYYYVDYPGFSHEKGLEALQEIIYQPYDVKRFISIAKKKLLGLIGITTKNKLANVKKAWICQEVIKPYLIGGGIPYELLKDVCCPGDIIDLPFIQPSYGVRKQQRRGSKS